MKKTFKPEFLNRIDEIVYFNKLDNSIVAKICDKFINQLSKRLSNNDKNLTITDAARDKIIEEGYEEEFGARPLKRYIQKNIESLIAYHLLENPNNKDIIVDYKEQFFIR